MRTIHILTAPDEIISDSNTMNPFVPASIKFARNMGVHGYNTILYCSDTDLKDINTVICGGARHKDHQEIIRLYNKIAGSSIYANKKSGDIIAVFYGSENIDACTNNKDLLIFEPSIGYDTRCIISNYRIFTSYCQMHKYYAENNMQPSYLDWVIPNAFDPESFTYKKEKQDYILFFGRVIPGKGVDIAIELANYTNTKLIIAGPEYDDTYHKYHSNSNLQFTGFVNAETRKLLMSDARAIIGPTKFLEPFGNMVIEGYFSGTPAITPDWGGFVDTVQNGVTGFRCRSFKEYVQALENINSIDNEVCYRYAMNNYTDEVVHKKFDMYIKNLISEINYE